MKNSSTSSNSSFLRLLTDDWLLGAQSRIARRFVFFTVVSSTLLALIATSLQLYKDYLDDLSSLDRVAQNIEETRVPSLIESLWSYEKIQIERQLLGMLHQDGVEYVEIIKDQSVLHSSGKQHISNHIKHSFPLVRIKNKQEFSLGVLHITIGLDQVYTALFKRGLLLLASNSIKTLLVAAVIIMIYQIMIGRHLTKLASFVSNNNPTQPTNEFSLDRELDTVDELGKLESAINQWISTHKNYEDQLLTTNNLLTKANTELENANYELSRFAYSASHDLKAPLASINGMLEFTEADIRNGKTKDALLTVEHAKSLADRLANRIEDMLVLAKSDTENDDWITLDIQRIVNKIWGETEQINQNQISTLTTEFKHDKNPTIVETRFEIILENLLSNAFKYANPTNKTLTVKIATESNNDCFLISISDNGIGIPEQYHSKVFGMFQRFSDTKQPGSGLGLAIVKKNIDKLNGSIDFISTPQGTCFKITLPLEH